MLYRFGSYYHVCMFALTYLVFTFAWLMYIFSVLLPYYYMGVGNCVKLGLGLGFRV
jgi:hypothetical protein